MKKQKVNPFVLAAVACAVVAMLLFLQFQKEVEAKHREELDRLSKEMEGLKNSTPKPVVIDKPATRLVVFTKIPIQPLVQVTREMFQTKEVPLDLIPPDAYTDAADVEGKYTSRQLDANELITRSKVKPKDQIGGLAFRLDPGMRAVSLTVQDPARAAGFFINDGDFVDLVQTDKEGTRTVLQNIKVLSIATGDPSAESSSLPRRTAGGTATFEVTPEQAQLLIQIEANGPIRLVLRSSRDKEVAKVKPLLREDFESNPAVFQKVSDRSVTAFEKKKAAQPENKNGTQNP